MTFYKETVGNGENTKPLYSIGEDGDKLFYKGFDTNLQGYGDFQFEVGKEYECDNQNELSLQTDSGFHFCDSLADVNKTFSINNEASRFCIVKPLGEMYTNGVDYVCKKILIVKELRREEINEIVGEKDPNNIGIFNVGSDNIGDNNVGYSNSGDNNKGTGNAGSRNIGDGNCGCANEGDENIGCRNKGDNNIGDYNQGYANIGDNNNANNTIGYFNSKEQTAYVFDIDTGMTLSEFQSSEYYSAMNSQPFSRLVGNILISHVEACHKWWFSLSEEARNTIQKIPNFNAKDFKNATGIALKQ